MSEIELKACPFCGGEAGIRKWQDEDLWSHAIAEWQKAHCTECECEGISSCPGYDPDTVQAWNTRPALTPPEGFVLVPVEPTDEEVRMTNDAQQEFFDANLASQFFSSGHYGEESIRHALRAVRAARPEVPNVND